MDAAELITKLITLGIDEGGLHDRFLDDAELYQICFESLINDANFDKLKVAMDVKDYEAAFDEAHALKGVAGNLGLTGLYNALFTFVESLRGREYEALAQKYAEIAKQQSILTLLNAGEPQGKGLPELVEEVKENSNSTPLERVTTTQAEELAGSSAEDVQKHFADTTASDVQPQVPKGKKSKESEKPQRDRFMLIAALSVVALIFVFGAVFYSVLSSYRDNIAKESASHILEINYQIQLYLEEEISNDYKIARSMGDSIISGNFVDDDESIFKMLGQKRDIWQVSDVVLYTENGYGICAGGDVQHNDIASDIIFKARQNGGCVSIVDSDIVYTVPILTDLRFKESRIVAVSVVHNMENFLDEMKFAPFDGKAWLYLTNASGVVISSLSNEHAVSVFNVTAITEGHSFRALKGDLDEDSILDVNEPTAFLMTNEPENLYVVSTPIKTSNEPLYLFYLAPELIVNDAMNHFSKQLTFCSLLAITSFSVFAYLILRTVYRNRKKKFDKSILARERMFDLLIEHTPEAFALYSIRNDYPNYVSPNVNRITGDDFWMLEKTKAGFRFSDKDVLNLDSLAQANEMLADWDGKSHFHSGYILNANNTPPSYFEFMLYPIDDEGLDFVGIAQDVTHTFAREEALKDAMKMAEQANAAKSRFLSSMSHDIRTPMNAIVNMTDFAIESINEPEKLKSFLQTISDSSEHLLSLINDILDMSRIESGKMAVNFESFDIVKEMNKQVEMIRPLCHEKKQTFIINFDNIKNNFVCGDKLKVAQIIINLLSNAVKFTPENGAVHFSAEEVPSLMEKTVNIRFIVEDTGIGISKDFIDHIFEPFSRANSRNVNKTEGTGLGLSICHSYIMAMGGNIKCDSELGEGTTFTVDLFFQMAESPTEAFTSEVEELGDKPFLGKRCLLVEDNETNLLIAQIILERLGFSADTASDGWEGVHKFLKSKPGFYDVIYMDVQMPIMDGYQATVTIRESEHPQAKTIPIIAMTANVFAEDIEKARIVGMNGHLGKPIKTAEMIEETNRLLRKKWGG